MSNNMYMYAFGYFRIELLIFKQVIEIVVVLCIQVENGVRSSETGRVFVRSLKTQSPSRVVVQTDHAENCNESHSNTS
ncbi:hypothetical protein ACOSQ2_031535 [Xanthoceras sorbifolium]